MIQDILPYRLNNTFQNAAPVSTDFFFSFQGEKVLLKIRKGGGCALPTFQNLQRSISEVSDWIVYLFSVDGVSIYLILQQDTVMLDGKCLHYVSIQSLSSVFPEWAYFAGITALHLGRWYERNVYCGKCGDMMEKDSKQRVLFCRKCGNMVYPAIAPVVMVAVTNGDKLLMTKYADRPLFQWVLISGFVEIGETLEEAAKREVFEETGIRIKDLQYFGSQPWGFSNSIIVGYTAKLDGSDKIHLDTKELAMAAWHSRTDLPKELTDISITYEMIEALRIGGKGGQA